jgi:hypothetical protein
MWQLTVVLHCKPTRKKEPAMPAEGPGAKHAGVAWIVSVLAIEFTLALLTLYLLIRVWPHPTPSMRGAEMAQTDTTGSQHGASLAKGETPAAGNAIASTSANTSTVTTSDTVVATHTSANPATDATAATPGNTAKGASVTSTNDCEETIELCECERTAEHERRNFMTNDRLVRFDPECVSLFGHIFLIWNEQRLMLLVILAGMIGGFVHAIRSMYWYIGNRNFIMSWLPMYAALPLVGAMMALMFYLVFRGGLFSPQSSIGETSPFGFAAMAALVGMFSSRAAVKLQAVFDTLLSKAEEGKNASKNPTPLLLKVTGGTTRLDLILEGRNFVEESVVASETTNLDTRYVDPTTLQATIPASLSTAGTTLKLTVTNPAPGGGESGICEYTVP